MLKCMWSCLPNNGCFAFTSKSLWPNSTDIPQKVLSINNASMYSDFLIKILLEWTINQHIDTQVVLFTNDCIPSHLPTLEQLLVCIGSSQSEQ